MKLKFLFFVSCTILTLAYAKSFGEQTAINLEDDSKAPNREKRESKVLDDLVKSGVALKRSAEAKQEEKSDDKQTPVKNDPKAPAVPIMALGNQEISSGRVKKQSPVLNCGKTECGPLVSAYGPGLGELRKYMHGNPTPSTETATSGREVMDEIDSPKTNPQMDFMRMNPPMDFSRMNGPMDYNTMEPPMGFNRMNPPMGFGRMNGPIDFNRMNGPMEFNRMNGPIEFTRMNGPTDFSRMNGPMDLNKVNSPVELNKMNTPVESSKMSSPTADIGKINTPSDTPRSQSKTFDVLGYNPLTVGYTAGGNGPNNAASTGYGYNTANNNYAGSSGYGISAASGNSFWKPPVQAPYPAQIQHPAPVQPIHPWFQHPWLNLNPHNYFSGGYRDPYDVPQPQPYFNVQRPQQPYYNDEDFHLICKTNYKKYPHLAQDKIDDEVGNKIDEKQLNSTSEPAARMADTTDETTEEHLFLQGKAVQEHLEKIKDIKEQISQLNRAAQKIIDQQEKFAELQQRHMYNGYKNGNSGQQYDGPTTQRQPVPYQQRYGDFDREIPPYYGGYGYPGYYPGGFGFSRASAASYPNSQEDTEFFMNLMHNLKRLGLLSNSFQQSIIAPVDDKKTSQSEDLISDLLDGDKQDKTVPATNTKNGKDKKPKEKENKN